MQRITEMIWNLKICAIILLEKKDYISCAFQQKIANFSIDIIKSRDTKIFYRQ